MVSSIPSRPDFPFGQVAWPYYLLVVLLVLFALYLVILLFKKYPPGYADYTLVVPVVIIAIPVIFICGWLLCPSYNSPEMQEFRYQLMLWDEQMDTIRLREATLNQLIDERLRQKV